MIESNSQNKNFTSCAICTDEFLLRYCQRNLNEEERLRLENHLIKSITCWENLVRFNKNFSRSAPNSTSLSKQPYSTNLRENIKLADLIMAEYLRRKNRDQLKANLKEKSVKSNQPSSTPSWENLSEAALLASMFPVKITTHSIITQAWQEFFRRYEQTMMEQIECAYKKINPDQEMPHLLAINSIESVLKYLQKEDYKKLRELRNHSDIPIKLFLKFVTYAAIEDIEPFKQLTKKEKQFLQSTLWQENKNLLIKLHGANALKLFHPTIRYQNPDEQPPKKAIGFKVSKYLVMALLIIAILPASFFIYYLSSSYSKTQLDIPTINNNISRNVIDAPTRYDLFNKEIDLFLQAQIENNSINSIRHLKELERLSDEINKKGDNFGKDLLAFYKLVSPNLASELYKAHLLSSKAMNTPGGGDYGKILSEIEEANKILSNASDNIDILFNSALKAKVLLKQGNYQDSNKLINDGLIMAEQRNYKYIYTLLLIEKANSQVINSKVEEAINTYKEVLDLTDLLETPKLTFRPLVSLCAIYYTSDKNRECFELTQRGLQLANGINNYHTVQLLHLAGVSAFNLGKTDLAEDYLNRALSASEAQQNLTMLVQSYMFMGIVKTAQNNLLNAESSFLKAIENINKMEDPLARSDMELNVTGYYAREQMLAGNIDKALALYEKSIALAEQLNVNQYLVLSQLHKGKAEVLIAKGNHNEAINELQTAVAFEKKAQTRSETTNSLLCFSITCKTSSQQLHELSH